MYGNLFVTFALLGVSVITGILVHVFLCLWVYRDAKNNCADAALWTVITLFTSLLGLILYYAVGRKMHKTKCPKCFAVVHPDSSYCPVCGQKLSPENIVGYPLYAAGRKKRAICPMVVCFSLSLAICVVTSGVGSMFMNYYVSSGSFDSFIKQYEYQIKRFSNDVDSHSSAKTDLNVPKATNQNRWDVSLDKDTTQKQAHVISIKATLPKKLYVDYGIDSGKVRIELQQGDVKNSYDISGTGSNEIIKLSDFNDGDVNVTVSTMDAKNADVEFSW